MTQASSDVWEVLSTARTIRRFTDEPVDDATLARCLQTASAQAWRFIVLRSDEQRAVVATAAEFTSVLFAQKRLRMASGLLLGGFDLSGDAERPAGGHIVAGWPKGRHGPVRRRPLAGAVNVDHWDQPSADLLGESTSRELRRT
jgi:nitroreductase